LPRELRSPRLRVLLNGAELPGAMSAEVESSGHFAADRFRLRFASNPVSQSALHTPGVWIEVQMSVDAVWVSAITGIVDSVSYDPTMSIIDVDGRDLSALLIESQTEETFANRTSSDIASIFAARHGLQAEVTPTSTPIGRYYQSEHSRVAVGQFAKATTEWDLLAFLATRENFDLFASGGSLCFGPAVADGAISLNVDECIALRLDHCVSLARPIQASVKSWNSKSGQAVTASQVSSGSGPVWVRGLTRPNLTADEAQQLAERILSDLKRHEWTASATLPGELGLSSRSLVALSGTNTEWDRMYHVTQLTRHLDVQRGFTQHIALQGA
jgi:phage protein D